MLMHYLAAIFKGLHLQTRVDDDFVDKLNYDYTSAVVFAFAIMVSAKQYVGQPIQCWVPAQFTDAWEQYTENYCWIENTYYLPIFHEVPIPVKYSERRARQLSYYQWVPFVLALEALMFYAPCIFWRGMLNWHTGTSVQNIAQMACEARMMDSDARAATVQTIAGHIQDAIEISREVTDPRIGSSFVAYLYIIVKAMYTVNCAAQVFILDAFLGTHDPLYGVHVVKDLLSGREWHNSGNFPRSTLCDFEIRVMGNVHHHTVQCVLMINMFNEKLFLFLWFWFVIVTVITFLSLLHWIVIQISPGQRVKFIKKYLKATDLATDQNSVKNFVYKFLGQDGVFCVRMISAHAGDILATELVVALWNNFKPPLKKSPMDTAYDQAQGKVTESQIRSWLLAGAKNAH